MNDHVGKTFQGRPDALLNDARPRMRLRQRQPRLQSERQEEDQALGGAQEAQLARQGLQLLLDDPLDDLPVALHIGVERRGVEAHLWQRLQVHLHRVELGHRGQDRLLDLLGHGVRRVERHVARQLEVQRQLEAAVDVKHRHVVDLPHVRDVVRGRARPLAHINVLVGERLDVDDDIGPRVFDDAYNDEFNNGSETDLATCGAVIFDPLDPPACRAAFDRLHDLLLTATLTSRLLLLAAIPET